MKTTILLLSTLFYLPKAYAQDIVFLKDSIMAQYMESGYSNKHFQPKGKEDENNLRQGFWEDYEVMPDFTMVTENGEPEQKFGYFLFYGEGNFVNGKRDGKWKFYVIEDQTFKKFLHQEVSYTNGEKNGSFKYFFPNENVAIEGTYLDNSFEGKTNWFYDDGREYGNISYKKSSREGNAKFRYKSGVLKDDLNYLNDSLSGTSTNYYENGKIKQIADYTFGKLNGSYKYYYENGQLWIEKIYTNGLLMTVVGSYDQKGKPRDFGTIKNGTGTVKYYTEEGKVYSIQTFKKGIMVKEENQ